MADFTDADVELVANVLDDRVETAMTWGELKDAAQAVLSALSGRLLPPGGETRTEWAVRLTWDDGRGYDDQPRDNEADARRMLDYHRRQKVEQAAQGRVWLVTPSLLCRQVHTGPWQPAEEEHTDG